MPLMIDDIVIPRAWMNPHQLTTNTPGNKLTVQNKGVYPILALIRAAEPKAGNMSGFRILPNHTWSSVEGDTVWLCSEGSTSMACLQYAEGLPPAITGPTLVMDFANGIYMQGKNIDSMMNTNFDGMVQFKRAGSANYWSSNGRMASQGVDAARFQTINGGLPALYLERAATNILKESQTPNTWGEGGMAGTANGALGMDGVTMNGFLTAKGTGFGQRYVVLPTIDRLFWDISIYVRPNVPNVGRFNIAGTGMLSYQVAPAADSYYDFATKTLGAGLQDGKWTATTMGGDWVRLSGRFLNQGWIQRIVLKLNNDANDQFVVGGVQVSAEPRPSSFIKTAGAAIERPADRLFIPNGNWRIGNGNVVVDADPGIRVELQAGGILVTGDGAVRSIKYDGTKPAPSTALKGMTLSGINLASGGFSGGNVPGVEGTDYFWSKQSNYSLYGDIGVKSFRIPFLWERIQPTLNGPLDVKELAFMKAQLDYAAKVGGKVLWDMHNYYKRKVGTVTYTIGSTQVPVSALVDAWKRLVAEFKDHPALMGYGLMNEPQNAARKWPATAQILVDAIRVIDPVNPIFVQSENWSNTQNWSESWEGLPLVGNNIIYEGHIYMDEAGGGGGGKYLDRNEDIPASRGEELIRPFLQWLDQWNVKGIIGETGGPWGMVKAQTALGVLYSTAKAKNVPVFYWAGGLGWDLNDATTMEVGGKLLNQKDMLIANNKVLDDIGLPA